MTVEKTCVASEMNWHICGSFDCIIDWLDHWQTMLSGLGAIVAAAFSIYYLRRQISGAAEQETSRRKKRFTAARARLPLQLSDTAQYASDAIELLKHYLDAAGAPPEETATLAELPRPTLPEQAIIAYETIIENTEEDDFANLIADMIAQMQVLNSRLRGLSADAPELDATNLQAYLMNAAKVHGYAASMFHFARRETDEPPTELDWDGAISALRFSGFYEEDYPSLFAFMERARDSAAAQR